MASLSPIDVDIRLVKQRPYVYCIFDRDGPLYFGKGTGKRAELSHRRVENERMRERLTGRYAFNWPTFLEKIEIGGAFPDEDAYAVEYNAWAVASLVRHHRRSLLNGATFHNQIYNNSNALRHTTNETRKKRHLFLAEYLVNRVADRIALAA